MAGKFEITKDKAGKFRFRLKAGNGEIIAVGEAYESKASALNGIDSLKRNAPKRHIGRSDRLTRSHSRQPCLRGEGRLRWVAMGTP